MSEQEQPTSMPPLRVGRIVVIVLCGVVVLLVAASHLRQAGSDDGPRIRRTRWIMGTLDTACESYSAEHMKFPWASASEVDEHTTIDSAAVCAEVRGKGVTNSRVDFLGAIPEPWIDAHGRVMDMWRRPIQFRVDPDTGRPVIWSFGPDGRDDTNDGKSPDAVKKPKGYYWFGKGDFGDDVVVGAEPR